MSGMATTFLRIYTILQLVLPQGGTGGDHLMTGRFNVQGLAGTTRGRSKQLPTGR